MNKRRTSELSRRLGLGLQVLNAGVPQALASAVVGVHPTTFARWRMRQRRGERLVRPRGPRRIPLDSAAREQVKERVRELHGLIGAEALRRSVRGLSRRQAGAIKADACRELERERKRGAERITITAPGVLRGFDAMQIGHRPRNSELLVCADGAVPYRTSGQVVEHYDGDSVAQLLDKDLCQNGAPLVIRFDRAKQHLTPQVRAVLDRYQVLVLQGPPHRPQYYGQLERQNREHRDWIEACNERSGHPDIAAMMQAVNGLWPRRTLGWRTAAEVWNTRRPVNVDRRAFREEVERRTRRLREKLVPAGHAELAERLAIEQALAANGLLQRKLGGWVLGNSAHPQ